jgi:hypothetical protein
VWFRGQKPQTYFCRQSLCPEVLIPETVSIRPKASTGEEGILASAQTILASLLPGSHESDQYFNALSRGLEGDLKESVLLLNTAGLDIAPALQGLSPAEYRLKLASVRDHSPDRIPALVRWQPGKPAFIPAVGVKPGLYRLSLQDESGDATGSEAWVFISGRSHFASDAAQFEQTESAVRSWPADTDQAAVRAVLRASLEALAKEQSGLE